MRRPRTKLQISTFPFLAVLLGAMGALIFLLLIMDWRSKAVRREKLRQATEAQRQEKATKEAERLAAWQRDQDAWEDKRRERETLLAEQERELHKELARVSADLTGAAAAISARQQETLRLMKEQESLQRWLADAGKTLESQRQARALTKEQEEAGRLRLAQLTTELARMERIISDLKSRKKAEVFSLVPYRGKHGESRKPIYVECSATGLIFQPEGKALGFFELTPERLRQEIETRGLKLTPIQAPPPGAPPRPELPKLSTGPYVLCLVRPDGIEAYERLATAILGYAIDFGYELVDADWNLDFRADPATDAVDPPTFIAKKGGTKSPSVPPARLGGGPTDRAPMPGSVFGVPGKTINPFLDGGKSPSGRFPAHERLPERFGSGAAPARPGPACLSMSSPPLGGGAGPARLSPASDAIGLSLLPRNESGVDGKPRSAGMPGPAGSAAPLAHEERGPTPAKESGEVAWRGGGSGGTSSAGGTAAKDGGIAPPRSDGDGGSPKRTEGAAETPGGDEPRRSPDEPGRSPGRDPWLDKPARPVSLGHILGNRDFVIHVACTENEAILTGLGKAFLIEGSTEDQARSAQALADAVENLIARRQASLRPGETPYRPTIRFQVYPGGLRAYYRVYPWLERLRVPMTRENIET